MLLPKYRSGSLWSSFPLLALGVAVLARVMAKRASNSQQCVLPIPSIIAHFCKLMQETDPSEDKKDLLRGPKKSRTYAGLLSVYFIVLNISPCNPPVTWVPEYLPEGYLWEYLSNYFCGFPLGLCQMLFPMPGMALFRIFLSLPLSLSSVPTVPPPVWSLLWGHLRERGHALTLRFPNLNSKLFACQLHNIELFESSVPQLPYLFKWA